MRGVRGSVLLLLMACGSATTRPEPARYDADGLEHGMATWYGERHQGGPTASGERFDMRAMTAAHKTLPMQTRVRVTNLKNGRQVVVRINDRGPYARGRIIDVSKAAARELGMIDDGVVPVTVEILPR